MVGFFISLVAIIVLIFFGILLLNGKGAFLIAGYNTLPKSEKEKYDEIALCKFMGKFMIGISFSILLWAFSDLFKNQVLFIIGLVLFLGQIVFVLVYGNTGNRFKKFDDQTGL